MSRPRNTPPREFPGTAPQLLGQQSPPKLQRRALLVSASDVRLPADPIAQLIAENLYPPRMHRSRAAEVVSLHFFEISPRSIERWDVPVRIINGRAYMETRALFEEAQRRVDAAPDTAA
ncbi:MAG: hypothetical protein NTY94_17155 [Alphaproteobacteria bacterium]|nr:hypothetical protein [Alphaproteobacteria bacterium]